PRQQGQMLGDERAGDGGANRGEITADFSRLIRLRIHGVEVTHAAVEEEENARIGGRLFPGSRDGPQVNEARQGSVGCRQQAPRQELSASRPAARGVRPEHAPPRGSGSAGCERRAWEARAGALAEEIISAVVIHAITTVADRKRPPDARLVVLL